MHVAPRTGPGPDNVNHHVFGERANERVEGRNLMGSQNVEMEPYYTIMKLPGEEEEELLEGLVVPPHHRIEHAHRRGGRGRRRGRRGGRR